MAQENVGININVQGNAVESIGNVKKALKEANAELINAQSNFGDYSQEAIAAAKRVAELKDKISEARETADLFDPGKKFQAFAGAVNAVAGGFTAVQGALGIVGAESEDLQKSLLKVQSALALSQGLSTITDSAKDFQRLATIVKTNVVTAFSTLRGAIIATGVGALAIGLALVVANFDKVKKAILNAIPGLGKFASTVGNVINSFTDLIGITNAASRAEQQRQAIFAKSSANTKIVNEGIERQIKLIQAQGAEQGKIDALRKQQINNELNDLKKLADTKGILRGEDAKKYKDLQNDLQVIDATAQKAREDAAKQAAEKSLAAGNKYAESQKKQDEQLSKERLEAQKEALLKLSELNNEIFLSTFKDENEKKKAELNLAFIKEKDDILTNTKLTEETKNQLILALRNKLNIDLDAINQAQKEKKLAQDAKDLEEAAVQMAKEDDLEFANLQKKFAKTQDDDKKKAAKELADLDKKLAKNETDLQLEKDLLDQRDALLEEQFANSLITEEQYTANVEANAKARVDIAKKEADQKIALAQQSAAALTALSDVVGKETAAGKALAVSAALINTYLGISAGVKLGFPAAIPAVAIAASTGFSAVKNIIATKVPGASGGAGNMSSPNLNASAPIAPPQPEAATTNISAQSINALGNQAIRSYVVESDVTSNQQRIAAIQQRARFG